MATEEIDLGEFDGRDKPYIPDDDLDIPGDVEFHTETADDLDPTTYEVIRHSLWNINQEHGNTIENLAVSAITLETRDFNPAIFQEDGDFLYFGPYLQFFGGVLDLGIKWVLENRSDSPGIQPGDMFLHNDPWVGTPHQPDVNLLCPVFHDGEIFCWVGNVMHQSDVGGTVPGSFCQNAEDIYHDPVPIPPVKVVEDGEIRQEVEDKYRRHSRMPKQLALDLRAGIAGNNHARGQIKELIDQYGAATVKRVMREITRDAESSLTEVLDAIPDGQWQERAYHEASKTGDRGTYEIDLTLTKDGDTLTFENEGTDPNTGAINLPFAGWRGSLLCILNLMLIPEEMGAVGGVARHVDFAPEPGTLTCPDYGVAVSPSGQYGCELAMTTAIATVSRMLLSSEDEEVRKLAMAPAHSQWAMAMLEGTNQRGDYYVGAMLEQMIGSSAATPYQDGQFADGAFYVPEGQGPNVEFYERDWPILYLYRGEQPDSGGEGYYRGGNGGKLAFVPHKGDVNVGVYTNDSVPKALGLFGADPGSRLQTRVLRDTDADAFFEDRATPAGVEAFDADVEHPPSKGAGLSLDDNDILEWTWMGSAGYGDPLDRPPERVVEDVEEGHISEETAADPYGVVLEDGQLDEQATEERRAAIREERLDSATVPNSGGSE